MFNSDNDVRVRRWSFFLLDGQTSACEWGTWVIEASYLYGLHAHVQMCARAVSPSDQFQSM